MIDFKEIAWQLTLELARERLDESWTDKRTEEEVANEIFEGYIEEYKDK